MHAITQVQRASEALAAAADGGFLRATLRPAVFGCPFGHATRIVTSPLPFGRCGDCGTEMAILDARPI